MIIMAQTIASNQIPQNEWAQNHSLLYTNDVKLYAATEINLKGFLRVTEAFTFDIKKMLHKNKVQMKNQAE